MQRYKMVTDDDFSVARSLAAWKSKVCKNWKDIKINYVKTDASPEQEVGNKFEVKASVYLGKLSPDDASVETYNGLLDPDGKITSGTSIQMTHSGSDGANSHLFICVVPCVTSGRLGYSLRVLPKNSHLNNPCDLGLITWEQ
jgi:starch phosphorylase